jgi:hypothetical protein
MKKILLIIFCFSAGISCQKENMGDCFKSTGEVLFEDREVSRFDTIIVYNVINLILTNEKKHSVRVEAGKNLLPFIETSVEDGKLIIRNNNKCNFVRSYKVPVNVYVSTPILSSLSQLGSGNITCTNTLGAGYFYFYNYSGADAEINLDAPYSYLNNSGGGDVRITGKSNEFYCFSRSSGFIFAGDFKTSTTTLNATGTGDIFLNAENELKILRTGAGNIYYSGEPEIINDSAFLGKGQLLKLEEKK